MPYAKLTWRFGYSIDLIYTIQQTKVCSVIFCHFIFLSVYMVCLAVNRFECKYSTAVTLSVKKWDQMNVFNKAIMIPQSLCITETLMQLLYVFSCPL